MHSRERERRVGERARGEHVVHPQPAPLATMHAEVQGVQRGATVEKRHHARFLYAYAPALVVEVGF